MRKLTPNREGALEYVRLGDMPSGQIGDFLEWLPQTCLTKINETEGWLENCVEYEDYEFWYDHFYKGGEESLEEEL